MAAEGITIQYLLSLKECLRDRGAACKELDNFFATGADRLARVVDVKTLQNLTTRLKKHLQEAVIREHGAQCASVEGDMAGSIGGLIAKGLVSTIAGPAWQEEAFEKMKAARQSSRQHCFGMIMVGVGSGGLPDDVHVISVSGRARTQNRPESKIIQELQQRGVLLFSPDVFLVMIDTLIQQLREGKLCLPISLKQLPAKLAVPRRVTVRLLTSVQTVPQLTTPKGTGTGDKGNLPNGTI